MTSGILSEKSRYPAITPEQKDSFPVFPLFNSSPFHTHVPVFQLFNKYKKSNYL